jgi:multidrug efflux pump subunit AcrA (membrane-fusion protein)
VLRKQISDQQARLQEEEAQRANLEAALKRLRDESKARAAQRDAQQQKQVIFLLLANVLSCASAVLNCRFLFRLVPLSPAPSSRPYPCNPNPLHRPHRSLNKCSNQQLRSLKRPRGVRPLLPRQSKRRHRYAHNVFSKH